MIHGPAAGNLVYLDPPLRERVELEILEGEKLHWIAQPHPTAYARGNGSRVLMIFAIPWTAFSVFWVYGAAGGFWSRPAGHWFSSVFDLCFPLFGVPFILVGLGMFTAPYWLKRKARKTIYALTDQRVIVFESNIGRGQTIRSYRPPELGNIERVERADNTGDLILAREMTTDSDGDKHIRKLGLIGLDNPRDVEQLIRRLLIPNQTQR